MGENIVEYIMVQANRVEQLGEKVREKMTEGFKPSGNLVSHNDKIVQAMIKEDTNELMKNFADAMNKMKKQGK